MPDNVYTCKVCNETFIFDDNPPFGDIIDGFFCSECTNELFTEIDVRLKLCGKDGQITFDFYNKKLTINEISNKYNCTEEQAKHSIDNCMGYITGLERKDISYEDWCRTQY